MQMSILVRCLFFSDSGKKIVNDLWLSDNYNLEIIIGQQIDDEGWVVSQKWQFCF